MGLRLSARAAAELSDPAVLAEFRDFLARNRMYVFTINGFPYGAFHGTRVKEEVYLPDWRDPERLRYTDLLADLLAQLLPDDPAIEGSVSTVPGAFKPALDGPGDVPLMVDHLLRHVAHLVRLRARTGRLIALALEPEPHCFLETIDEVVAFFEGHLHGPAAAGRVMELTGSDRATATRALHDHLGVCLDLCHAAVEFERPAECARRLELSGIRVLKMQISAGLRLPTLDPDAIQALSRFDDAVYLHQVVQQGPGGLLRFADLSDAFASLQDSTADREWRVHFHVPIFLDQLGPFTSTQAFVREMLAIHRAQSGVGASGGGDLHMGRAARTVSQRDGRRGGGARAGVGALGVALLNLGLALRLGRISNLPTVWTNVLVGVMLAGGSLADTRLALLMLALSLFYVGGMFLNDAFDRDFDAKHRPERPIPSGQVSAREVFIAGFGLLALGMAGVALASRGPEGAPAWTAMASAAALAAAIVFYNAHHKDNPLSPLIMGLCRVLVVATAAFTLTTALPTPVLLAAIALLCHLIGLTYIAKQEHLDRIGSLWPLGFLSIPVAYGSVLALSAPVAWVPLVLYAGVLLYSLSLLRRRARGDVPRAVVTLIAGMSVLDGVMLAGSGHVVPAVFAVAAFLLTLVLQRWVSGT